MDTVFAVPALWVPSGNAGRLIGLSAVKSITFSGNEQGVYIQVLSQNVRMTLDGTNPVASGNDTGFELRSTDQTVLITGQLGMTIKFIQVAANAVVQYQMLTLSGRYA